MFSPCSNEPVGFDSSWKGDSTSTSTSVATDPLQIEDKEVQVTEVQDNYSQTIEEISAANDAQVSYNEASLVQFLQKIAPKVEEELQKQNRSCAFDSYSQLDDDSDIGLKQLHVLRWQQLLVEDGVVSGLDWSCTGSVIGVAYSAGSHNDWCDHKAAVAIWNINRSDFSPNLPEQVIETSSCVTSIAFHPKIPAIFAVGTFSGEVLVYDLSLEDEVGSIVNEELDGCSITSVTWTLTSNSHTQYYLVCTTSSGAVLTWAFDNIKQTLSIYNGFVIMEKDVPNSVKSSESSGVAVQTITFNKDNPSMFVVGAGAGSLMLCSADSNIPSGVKQGSINLNKCVTNQLSPHSGKVLVSEYSLHHRFALMSLSSDNQLRLYSILQPKKPVFVIHSETSLTTACLSPSKAVVVVAGTTAGEVRFYSFANKTHKPILTLPPHEKPAAISSLVFNKKNISLIAVGDIFGRVTIWQLPSNVISQVSTDQSVIASLVEELET